MKWIKVNNQSELQEGDILELNTEYPLVLHYAVMVIENNERKAAHYPYPNSPCIENLDYVINNRPDNTIRNVLRTGVSSKEIIDNHNKIEMPPKEDFTDWLFRDNCENYVRDITKNNIGTDQRATALLVLIIIILVLILIFK